MITGSSAAEALLEKNGHKVAWKEAKEVRELAEKQAQELAEKETQAAKLLDAKESAQEAGATLNEPADEGEKRKAGRPPKAEKEV